MSIGIPGLDPRVKVQRTPPNPNDKTTIFSICPIAISERKYTLFPGIFEIEPGSVDNPSSLIVGSSGWVKHYDDGTPPIEIPHHSIQIAESVVSDYARSLFATDYPQIMPGVFFIPGVYESAIDAMKKNEEFKPRFELAQEKQKRWFENLVKLTDALWARSNGNPLAVPDHAKTAAENLGLKEKPWMKDFVVTSEMEACPACGEMRKVQFPVCRHCNTIIDKVAYSKAKFEKAS